MGEEIKEEEKKEGGEEKKEEEKKEEEPQEIVLRVALHCEACAKKVARSLKGFEGVEGVKTDCKSHKVVVKGKTADPVKVCERVQKKSGRKVEIISPLPKPPEEEKKPAEEENKENKEEKKDEPPPVITVVLNVRMHCEACAQAIQKRIRKIGGVESVVTDLMNSQVIVKGVIDPTKLVEEVYKKTRRHASIIVKDEEEKKEEKKEEDKKEEEKKEEDKKEEEKKEEEKKEVDEDGDIKSDIKKSEYWPTKYYYHKEYYAYPPQIFNDPYPPQIFSDENPNACSVM